MQNLFATAVAISALVAATPQYAQQYHAQQQKLAEERALQAAAPIRLQDIVSVRGILVHRSIADKLEAMISAAEKDGIRLTGTGYRSTAVQINLRRLNCGPTHTDIYTKPESACRPPTAIPGTSLHEKGLAVDFWESSTRDTANYKWLAKHARAYGFINRDDEPWHWSTTGR